MFQPVREGRALKESLGEGVPRLTNPNTFSGWNSGGGYHRYSRILWRPVIIQRVGSEAGAKLGIPTIGDIIS